VNRFVVISGCSGGGKSTLLGELGRQGHAVVKEPGRRIVREETIGDGSALPWVDMAAFLRRAVAMALAEYLRLLETYPSLGYEVSILPRVGVAERADFVLKRLQE